ncbi:hypothetical protein BGZ99_007615 [Dissophora globulifera]|uniref:Uncharacterized protein n=1 Tax=Dissophora globulifera TaxID=979702 RepID=A0A9P6UPH5_9FUNG|nr:hypothetical protein BGZ99_007615 [Dissophora globulifera]
MSSNLNTGAGTSGAAGNPSSKTDAAKVYAKTAASMGHDAAHKVHEKYNQAASTAHTKSAAIKKSQDQAKLDKQRQAAAAAQSHPQMNTQTTPLSTGKPATQMSSQPGSTSLTGQPVHDAYSDINQFSGTTGATGTTGTTGTAGTRTTAPNPDTSMM